MTRFILFISILLTIPVFSQDKKAKAVLDKLGEKYESFKTVEVQITMTLEFPERGEETSDIEIIQSGSKFVYHSPEQDMYCNGKDLWLYLKDRNEVQINNYDDADDSGMITPLDLLEEYRTGYYKYRHLGTEENLTQVELVPTDEWDDYAKIQLTINRKTNILKRILAIGKDGSRITLRIDNLTPNKKFKDQIFSFDIDKHEGIVVEDLRID